MSHPADAQGGPQREQSRSGLRRFDSDGMSQGTFSVGTQAEGVAFDGTNIWVANFGSNSVTELRASDGGTLGTSPVGSQPTDVAFDASTSG